MCIRDRDVDFTVGRGERIVVCGPSGSGKSTLIRCVNGLETHEEGQVILDGVELTDDRRTVERIRREVGMVFQQFNLFPHLTVLENVALGLSWWKAQRRVVLPQALVLVIPSFVNSVLSTFLDTSLVTVVSIYDLTGALRLALGDARWRDFFLEGYLFVGAVYLGSCLALSRYSHWLEGRLARWART